MHIATFSFIVTSRVHQVEPWTWFYHLGLCAVDCLSIWHQSVGKKQLDFSAAKKIGFGGWTIEQPPENRAWGWMWRTLHCKHSLIVLRLLRHQHSSSTWCLWFELKRMRHSLTVYSLSLLHKTPSVSLVLPTTPALLLISLASFTSVHAFLYAPGDVTVTWEYIDN